MGRVWDSTEFSTLKDHAKEVSCLHLRDLLQDVSRCNSMCAEFDGITLDYSRQLATTDTMEKLKQLAESVSLQEKLKQMSQGKKINVTENRAVLHTALRAARGSVVEVDGENVVPKVHEVLERVKAFSARVRSGEWVGASGKPLTDVVCIGIGGSYLGPEFVHEALRTDQECAAAAKHRRLRFLANVDPIDVTRALDGLSRETTLVVIVSKTFTTAETMLNARTVRQWLLGNEAENSLQGKKIVSQQVIAVSAAVQKAKSFGIQAENVFGFWNWVGGRYSVCSAVGAVPLSLQYGFKTVEKFLSGARSMDEHLVSAPILQNLPILLGLLGVWNSTFLGFRARALLPYCQALLRFPAHIQQVDMESNGKRVTSDGTEIPFDVGEVNFGEPGTNGQHSFYQLLHQGSTIPADFIGFIESQQPRSLPNDPVSNHDELMSNFFAQPDALALGKTKDELIKEGVPQDLLPHKAFPGNRPSSSLLFQRLDPYTTGQLLALYEHRTAVQGFIWGNCSFDQWGVELGKVLARRVRNTLHLCRKRASVIDDELQGFNASTSQLLRRYLAK
eukprot:g919.t1